MSDVRTAPTNWFREEPHDAAELYALELYGQDRTLKKLRVNVRDVAGTLHVFSVTLRPTVEASVKRVS